VKIIIVFSLTTHPGACLCSGRTQVISVRTQPHLSAAAATWNMCRATWDLMQRLT